MYDTKPLMKINDRLNELEPILKVYFPHGICKANTINPRLQCSHLDIRGKYTGFDSFEFDDGYEIIPCRFTQAINRIGKAIFLHCPKTSESIIKWNRNRVLIVDAYPFIYILNMKILLKLLKIINETESNILLKGNTLHVDILKMYFSIDLEKLITFVPEVCIDRLEILDKCFKTMNKKTKNGDNYYPICFDNLIWHKFKIFISKCPSYVIIVDVNRKTVERTVGIRQASAVSGCSESKIKKCLAGIQLKTKDTEGNVYGFFSEKQINNMGVKNEEELLMVVEDKNENDIYDDVNELQSSITGNEELDALIKESQAYNAEREVVF